MTKAEQKDALKKVHEALLKLPITGETSYLFVQLLDAIGQVHNALVEELKEDAPTV